MDAAKRRRCLFCGVGELSKEHLLPQWIVRTYGSREESLGAGGPFGYAERLVGGEQVFVPRLDRPFVPPADRKVRMVCASCNNGWMSTLEAKMKSICETLVESARVWSLSRDDLITSRQWLVKTALMLEKFDRNAAMSSPGAFAAAYCGMRPPGSWYFGIGQTELALEPWVGTTPVFGQMVPVGDTNGKPVASRVFALQHVIRMERLMFVVRHSCFRSDRRVRLDHDLYRHWSGPFVRLDPSSADIRWDRRRIANLHESSVEDIVFQWSHPIRHSEAFTLLGRGRDRWIGLAASASAEELTTPISDLTSGEIEVGEARTQFHQRPVWERPLIRQDLSEPKSDV